MIGKWQGGFWVTLRMTPSFADEPVTDKPEVLQSVRQNSALCRYFSMIPGDINQD